MDDTAPIWTGRVERKDDGTIGGTVTDTWSWPVYLTLSKEDGQPGYAVCGFLKQAIDDAQG
jgi:hypothetical protein